MVFLLGRPHAGVYRGRSSPALPRVSLSLHAGISQQNPEKRHFPVKSRCQPSPLGDLMLVGLESGLPCHFHRKDCLWLQESTTIAIALLLVTVPHLHRRSDFF